MSLYRRRILQITGCLLFLSPTAALADEPVETALKAFVASIDASPDWTATYRGLSYDPATGTGTLSGLSIRSEKTPTHFDFESLSVSGYADTADGGFTAKDIKADGGTVVAGFVTLSLDNVDIADLAVPRLAPTPYDPAKPFTSMIRVYSEITKVSLGRATIGAIGMIQNLNGLNNRITYRNFAIDGMKDGKIASVKAGPLSLETPSPEGLVGMNVASLEATGMDLSAMVHVYDPDAYVGGVGDRVWHTMLQKAAYSGVSMDMPGVKVTIGGLAIDDFRVRQPKKSFAGFFDMIMSNPGMAQSELQDEAKVEVLNMLGAMGFGRFAVNSLNVTASGIDRLALGDFHINELSADGLGEMGIGGLEGLVQGQGSIKVGRFAFGGITFPSLDAIEAAIAAQKTHSPVDPRTLAPKLGFVDAAGLELISADFPRTALASLRLDLGKYAGPIPTAIAFDMKGLDVPTQFLDRQARQTLAVLGLDRIQAEYRLKMGWDPATQILDVSDFHAGVAKLGAIGGTAKLGGITDPEALSEGDIVRVAPDASLIHATLTFTDYSVVDKALAMLAAKMKFPPDKIRQQFADALPFLLSVTVLTDPTMMKIFRQSGLLGKVTPAIKTFMAVPGSSITATFAPAKPVPLAGIEGAVQATPETVLDTLGFSLSADGKPAIQPGGGEAVPEKPAASAQPAAPAEDELRKTQPAN